jgi:hypothetical protein
MQIEQHDLVMELAPPLLENWEMRKAHKRDILLALALAYCGKAKDMFASEQVRGGAATRAAAAAGNGGTTGRGKCMGRWRQAGCVHRRC